MKVSMQRLVFATSTNCAMIAYSVQAQVKVTTYHNDISRTGQNTQETILAPSNVNSSQFGKFFTVGVDGEVFAQPLYLVNVYIGGGTHNVLYVATEHDSVYAIDADTGTVYSNDVDVASGGLMLLPTLSSGQQLLAQVGKSGTLLFLDRNNLGKYCVNQAPACTASDPQIVQEIPNANSGVWGSPAYWNNFKYGRWCYTIDCRLPADLECGFDAIGNWSVQS